MTKQVQTNFRTSPEMKVRLEESAAANGTTFNKEVNRRLAESLDPAPAVEIASAKFAGLLQVIAIAMDAAGRGASFSADPALSAGWLDNPHGYNQAAIAARRILDAFAPSGDIIVPKLGKAGDLDLDALSKFYGVGVANGLIDEIVSEDPTSTTAVERAPRLRAQLGSLTRRLEKARS